ncbi:MAG: nucleolar complex-associated protein-domain-containing protein [Benniella sp.]|nr:MAG: nucleolar complex-associated protein-domain-containing protein [Benniella sp.]
MAQKKGRRPAPVNKVAPKKAKPNKNKKDKGEKQIKVPKIVTPNFEVSEDVEIDEEDIEFFQENKVLSGFLSKMDAVKLAKNEIIKAKKKTTFGALKKGSIAQTTEDVESEPESIDSENSDLEDMDINMDDSDEPMSDQDMEDGHYESSDDDDEDQEYKTSRISDSDEEQDYEQAPRRPEGWSDKGSTRLPIKLADGRIKEVKDDRIRPSELKRLQEEQDEDTDSSDDEELEEPAEEMQEEEKGEFVPHPETKLSKKALLAQKKEQMASIAQEIIADPETNIGQLKVLRTMAQDSSDIIKKLAMLTQLAVYKDILPGYRIRPLTDKEKSVTVSKDVAKLRDYEQSLLQNYQSYLQSLEKVLAQDRAGNEEDDIVESKSKAGAVSLSVPAPTVGSFTENDGSKKAKADLATVAIHCMCNLLTNITHFNFRLNLMTALIARMSRRHWSELSETCSKTFKEVFKEDESGEASLDAVKLITKMIKSKSYLVHPNVINVFLTLRLKEELPTRHGGDEDTNPKKRKKKEKVHISKKNRKLLKAKKEVETEMKEAEAVVDKEEKLRVQTETLKLVFVTYFRVLKHAPGSSLLPAVLEGLAKFAHLINVDFFTDLVEVLKKIMTGGPDAQNFDPYSPANRRTQLLCIVTAFRLLQGQGEALNIDLKVFYSEFYTCLLTVAMNPDIEGNIFEVSEASAKEKEKQKQATKAQWKGKNAPRSIEDGVLVLFDTDLELIMKGFELLFFTTKGKIPVIRSASFLKRIAIASLQFPNRPMKDFLTVMKRLIQKQPQLDQLLTGSDEDRAGNGVYLPALNDPELCNPMAASLWELELMKMARELSTFTPSAGQRTHDRTIN